MVKALFFIFFIFFKLGVPGLCRFHVLTEFDEEKRSCRRRLAGHNERRRKPHVDTHTHHHGIGLRSPSPLHSDTSSLGIDGASLYLTGHLPSVLNLSAHFLSICSLE